MSFLKNLNLSARQLQMGMNLWPPFVGAGIRVRLISDDYKHVVVDMPLLWRNRNYVGTQFGGSLYSMTDPFYMLMLINQLGPRYVVWDQAASIRFVKPGRGRVTAEFRVGDEDIAEIQRQTAEGQKLLRDMRVDVVDDGGDLVAEVEKTLYIRLKREFRPEGGA
jgi:acyl-coenzyme A thioesterase PaaI-like protein